MSYIRQYICIANCILFISYVHIYVYIYIIKLPLMLNLLNTITYCVRQNIYWIINRKYYFLKYHVYLFHMQKTENYAEGSELLRIR